MATAAHSSDMSAADNNWSAFLRAYDAGHENYLKIAAKCNDFYLNEQWDPVLKREIEADGRPALTINEILGVVNAIYGHYSQTRADIRFKPRRRGATAEMAHVATRLVDHIFDESEYHERIEPQVMLDGIIEERGYFDIRMDYSENVLGEVRISSLDPRTVVLDPDAKEYDPDTWTEVSVDRWLSLDDIELYYGKDKRDSVNAHAYSPTNTFGDRSVKYDTYAGQDIPGLPADLTEERRVKSVRVIERQYRKLGTVREFVDPRSGEFRAVPEHWDEGRVASVADSFGLVVRKHLRSRIRWTVTADRIVLHDDWSPYEHFTVVPFFPIFRRGRPTGLVRYLLDPQEQLNKTESQVLHVINTTANSGWLVEEGSLANMEVDELANRGAESGLVLSYRKGRQPPEKIMPNPVPTGLEHFAMKAQGHVRSLVGAEALLSQAANPEISGVQLDKTMGRALQGLQVVFDNLEYSRKLVAKRVLSLVQKFYTEARVYHVTDWRDPEEPQETIAINQQIAGQLVNDITAGDYLIKVGTMPARDTFEETQFAEMIAMREAGVASIPDYQIILSSHLAGKEAIAQESKQLQGLGEQSPEQQQAAQAQLQLLLLEVERAQVEIMEKQADTQLKLAKARTEMAGQEREMFEALSQHERELARMRIDLEKTAANLRNKLQLAEIHSESKDALTRYGKLMEAGQRDRDRSVDLTKAGLQAQTQLATARLSKSRDSRAGARQRPGSNK